ncbi:MAG: DUF2281 domain-containing protein [Nostocaceae cyanobacterium]|nr:DUF2281 domain-containing protein [Nostocaceae cyanobacterium]
MLISFIPVRIAVTFSALLIKLQALPPQQQQQVLDFVEFLTQKYVQSNPNYSQKKRRIAGLHEGMGWIAEDFNAPLSDEFWMGQE